MKKHPIIIIVLLLALALLLCACAEAEPAASPPLPARQTPCSHVWQDGVCTVCGEACPHLFEDGVCTICGAACPHEWQDGVCTVCGLVCPHAEHDGDAVCLLCGMQRWHSYHEGCCTGCGREPLLYTEMLPERYLKPAEHQGTCLNETLTWPDGRSYPMSVYLPYGYDEQEHYNLVIFLLGDNNHAPDCTETLLTQHGIEFRLSWIYDHMLEEHLCAPFILVGVEHLRSLYDEDNVTELLRECLLPRLVKDYATWVDGEGEDAIAAAREHIAICGASRGAVFVLDSGMRSCADLAASFCCMSCGQVTLDGLRDADSELFERCGANSFIVVWGWSDPYAWTGDRRCFERLVEMSDCLTEGVNAYSLAVHDGHNWVTWSAGLFAALQYMF